MSRELSEEKKKLSCEGSTVEQGKGESLDPTQQPECSDVQPWMPCVWGGWTEQPLVIRIHGFGWGLLLYRAA